MKKKVEERQREVVVMALAIGVGFMLGARFQRRIDLNALKVLKKTTISLTKSPNQLFPDSMPLEEIKKVLSLMPGAKVIGEAIIVQMDGVERWIIR